MDNEPRQRKGKKAIEWESPRYYQKALHRRNPNSYPAKRKRGWCKRLKSPHEYGEGQIQRWHTGEPMYSEKF